MVCLMAPWYKLVESLTAQLEKCKEDGRLGDDPISMREINAMADYNLARSRNLFGSLQNAFDQRSSSSRKVPLHMMPDFMTWLKYAQPDVYYHLYGPDPTPDGFHYPRQRARDTRSRSERRAAVVAQKVDDEQVSMPATDDQGRIVHVHSWEDKTDGHSYRVRSGSLNEQRQRQIRPEASTLSPEEAEERRRLRRIAAEKRRDS